MRKAEEKKKAKAEEKGEDEESAMEHWFATK